MEGVSGDQEVGASRWAPFLPASPSLPPEQRGSKSLVEASDATALQQVPGQLGGRGPWGRWSLHWWSGVPLGWELGLGSQYLLLGIWENGEGPAALPPNSGRAGIRLWLPLPPPSPLHALTNAARVLKLDLQHLHGGCHDHLAGARSTACQHLLK